MHSRGGHPFTSIVSLLSLALIACLGGAEAGIPQQEQPADAFYRWPDYWDDNFNYPPEEKYSEVKQPMQIIDLKHGNKSYSADQANMTVSVWNKRKGHVVRDISKNIYKESFFYEMHFACHLREVDISQWEEGKEHTITCNFGQHISRHSRDWLQVEMQFDPARREEENLKTMKCIDQFQEPNDEGDFHGAEKVIDTDQNCYVYFVNSTATVYEPGAESRRRQLQDAAEDSSVDSAASGTSTEGSADGTDDTTSSEGETSADDSSPSSPDSTDDSTSPADDTTASSGDAGSSGADAAAEEASASTGDTSDGSSNDSTEPDTGSTGTNNVGTDSDTEAETDTGAAETETPTDTTSTTDPEESTSEPETEPPSSGTETGAETPSDGTSGTEQTEQQTSRKLANFTMHVMRPLNTIDANNQDIAIPLNSYLGIALQLIIPGEERTTGTTVHVSNPGGSARSYTKGELTK